MWTLPTTVITFFLGIIETLATLDVVDSGLNVCILDPSDNGRYYLVKAIGIAVCNSYKGGTTIGGRCWRNRGAGTMEAHEADLQRRPVGS